MATYSTYYQSAPLSIPGKAPAVTPYYPVQRQNYSVSPPEVASSVSTRSGMANSYSAATPYASESDSNASANGVDLHEYMQDRLSDAFDPLPLDRTMAVQAQT